MATQTSTRMLPPIHELESHGRLDKTHPAALAHTLRKSCIWGEGGEVGGPTTHKGSSPLRATCSHRMHCAAHGSKLHWFYLDGATVSCPYLVCDWAKHGRESAVFAARHHGLNQPVVDQLHNLGGHTALSGPLAISRGGWGGGWRGQKGQGRGRRRVRLSSTLPLHGDGVVDVTACRVSTTVLPIPCPCPAQCLIPNEEHRGMLRVKLMCAVSSPLATTVGRQLDGLGGGFHTGRFLKTSQTAQDLCRATTDASTLLHGPHTQTHHTHPVSSNTRSIGLLPA